MELEKALHHYFNYTQFRQGQKEVITSLLAGRDTFAILPTGTGKSLCYQLTGYLKDGLVLVVSPLISLMEDQVLSLQKLGEKRVIALNGLLSVEEKQFVLNHLNQYKFVFLSPEMLLQKPVIDLLKKQHLALLVVDEAHCVSQWGVDFRPEYRNLGTVKQALNRPLTLALTASATENVRRDIKEHLLFQATECIYSADRPNIALVVHQSSNKMNALKQILSRQSGAGIIYCATRKQVERLYKEFERDFAIGYYHGGLPSNQRKMLQQQFLDNQLQFLIATNAFGMGINKPDVRFVVHYELPDSLENYMQEIGRAGRDGLQSEAILLYQPFDEGIHYFLQKKAREERQLFEVGLNAEKRPVLSDIQEKWLAQAQKEGSDHFLSLLKANEAEKVQKLDKMLAYIHCKGCRRQYLLAYFAENKQLIQQNCCDFHGYQLSENKEIWQGAAIRDASWQQILIKLFKEKK